MLYHISSTGESLTLTRAYFLSHTHEAAKRMADYAIKQGLCETAITLTARSPRGMRGLYDEVVYMDTEYWKGCRTLEQAYEAWYTLKMGHHTIIEVTP